MKTCSSSVKNISDGENHFMQNICNKWMRYRNILPNKNNPVGDQQTIYLLGVVIIEIANLKLTIKKYFYMI